MAADSSPNGAAGNPFLDYADTPQNSNEHSHVSSPDASRPNSAGGGGRGVRFGPGETLDLLGNRTAFDLSPYPTGDSVQYYPTPQLRTSTSSPPPRIEVAYFPDSPGPISGASTPGTPGTPVTVPPKSFAYKKAKVEDDDEINEKYDTFTPRSVMSPQQRMSKYGGSYSAPTSARNSPVLSPYAVGAGHSGGAVAVDDIPTFDISDETKTATVGGSPGQDTQKSGPGLVATREAQELVRQHTRRGGRIADRFRRPAVEEQPVYETLPSGYNTPMDRRHADYIPKPDHLHGGVLGNLLKLYHQDGQESRPLNGHHSAAPSISSQSGRTTPKWYTKSANTSSTSLGSFLAATGAQTAATAGGAAGTAARVNRPKLKHRPHSGGIIDKFKSIPRSNTFEEETRITVHIASLLQRQKYIIKICRALMLYGAPTHRMEEALKMTSRVLQIDAQFLYIPGCMIMSFGDQSTHTSEMQIVRTAQGLDMAKLHDCHLVYKEVIHDCIGVEEAIGRLDDIINRKPLRSPWVQVFIYGIASATVGPFGFKAGPMDIPVLFLLGCMLGFLQLILAPRSELYSNVFEISAAIITSFFARMFGSINGGNTFCFSALAQASIALILPGYIILCGSLELQSKNIVAGSVRMFYAIIYSLFLGFGITIGSALYGLVDKNATSATTCQNPFDWRYNSLWVGAFALCLLLVNQARWRQAPVMVGIALAGYVVNYFSSQRFVAQPQIANGLGAFTVGVLGNLYSRVGHGLAFAAMLPAIFVQVPSGLAAQGSLLAGLEGADAILKNSVSTPISGTSIMFEFGFSMVQVAIGTTVGLFAAALVVYPIPKKRSGLFSF